MGRKAQELVEADASEVTLLGEIERLRHENDELLKKSADLEFNVAHLSNQLDKNFIKRKTVPEKKSEEANKKLHEIAEALEAMTQERDSLNATVEGYDRELVEAHACLAEANSSFEAVEKELMVGQPKPKKKWATKLQEVEKPITTARGKKQKVKKITQQVEEEVDDSFAERTERLLAIIAVIRDKATKKDDLPIAQKKSKGSDYSDNPYVQELLQKINGLEKTIRDQSELLLATKRAKKTEIQEGNKRRKVSTSEENPPESFAMPRYECTIILLSYYLHYYCCISRASTTKRGRQSKKISANTEEPEMLDQEPVPEDVVVDTVSAITDMEMSNADINAALKQLLAVAPILSKIATDQTSTSGAIRSISHESRDQYQGSDAGNFYSQGRPLQSRGRDSHPHDRESEFDRSNSGGLRSHDRESHLDRGNSDSFRPHDRDYSDGLRSRGRDSQPYDRESHLDRGNSDRFQSHDRESHLDRGNSDGFRHHDRESEFDRGNSGGLRSRGYDSHPHDGFHSYDRESHLDRGNSDRFRSYDRDSHLDRGNSDSFRHHDDRESEFDRGDSGGLRSRGYDSQPRGYEKQSERGRLLYNNTPPIIAGFLPLPPRDSDNPPFVQPRSRR